MAWGTPTNIATGTDNGNTTIANTVPVGGVPAGALIVVVVTQHSGTAAGTVTDTHSNTYTLISGASGSVTTGWMSVFYAYNVTALTSGNTITCTLNAGSTQAVMTSFYITGELTSSAPLDTAVTNTATGSSTSPSVTSGTPGASGEFFVGIVGFYETATTTFTQDSTNASYISLPTYINSAFEGAAGGGCVVNAGSGTLKYNPTIGTSQGWRASIIAFKLPAVAGNPSFAGEAIEFPPRAPGRAIDLLTWTQAASQSQFNALPVVTNELDWPVPKAPVGSIDLRSWQKGPNPSLSPPVVTENYDWPVPKAAQGSSDLRTWLQSLSLNQRNATPVVTNQIDWPVPKAPGRASDLITWLQSFSEAQATAAPVVTDQLDWPVPKAPGRANDLITWLQSFSLPQANALPVVQRNYDWPVPKGPQGAIDLRTWLQSLSLTQLTATPVVTWQLDWPVPKASARSIDLITWAFPSNPNLFAPVIYPATFGQFDWPVPKGAAAASDLRTWLQSFSLVQRNASPVTAQFDWPVPRAAQRLIDLTWVHGFQYTAVIVQAPFSQTDWPLTYGARSNDLRTWSYSYNFNLIGQDNLMPQIVM